MKTLAMIAVALVALEHLYILVLEMFFWDKPKGLRAFGMTQEFATSTKALAANQGLYNGFLAAGLAWGLAIASAPVQIFFLLCVIVAGVFGAATAKLQILYIQAVPAAIALALVLFTR
ncbi:MAG: DUF1304 domain-containing protein [Rhizobiales bacterium]|nr:DUF1304 domain-containing protein [Hyphomicrobiales bacterium]